MKRVAPPVRGLRLPVHGVQGGGPDPEAADRDDRDHLREEVRRLRAEVSRLTPSLAVLLKTRGFHLYAQRPPEPPLIPGPEHLDAYYSLLQGYAFRLFLRDVIRCREGFSAQDVTRFASRQVTERYLEALLRSGLAASEDGVIRLVDRRVRSFGPTLEWFVAEVFRREYRTESHWGVRFKRPRVGGDYDVIARLGERLVYTEVKSSPPKQIYQSEVNEFLRRVDDLRPEIAIFLMDTELRMKDKLVPMFEEALVARGERMPVARMERELFHIGNRVFLVNTKAGIEGALSCVIRWYFLYNIDRGR